MRTNGSGQRALRPESRWVGDVAVSAEKAGVVRRVGVVGCGYWGVNHVRNLCQIGGLDVTPIDAGHQVAERCASEHRLENWATQLRDVVDDLDAVVISTPPSSHHALGMMAIDAGCHVLIEKPLAVNSAECDDLIRAATEAERTLATGHTFLFSPAVERLAETVKSPTFGGPVHITSERLNLGLYRSDVDVLWDLAPHDVSIVNYVLDAEPTSVQCWATGRHSMNSDIATLALTYEDPHVTATIQVSWLHPEKVRRMTVVGENQMVLYDDTIPGRPIQIHDTAVRLGETISYERGDVRIPTISGGEPLRSELEDFLEAARTGRPPRADGRAGRAVVDVLQAATESIATGGRVYLPHRGPSSSTDSDASNVVNLIPSAHGSDAAGGLPVMVGEATR